jgi:hypothetical protein
MNSEDFQNNRVNKLKFVIGEPTRFQATAACVVRDLLAPNRRICLTLCCRLIWREHCQWTSSSVYYILFISLFAWLQSLYPDGWDLSPSVSIVLQQPDIDFFLAFSGVLYVCDRLRTTNNKGAACSWPRFGRTFGSCCTALIRRSGFRSDYLLKRK